MKKDSWLFSCVAGFVGGVACHSFFDFGLPFAFLCIGVATLSLLFLWVRHSYRIALLIPIFIFAFGLGLIRYDISSPLAPTELQAQLGKAATFTAVIIEEPDVRENAQLLTVSIESFKTFGDDTKVEAKVLVNTDRYGQYAYGDQLRLRGSIEEPKNFETDNGRVFDYKKYLEKEGISYVMFRPSIEVVERGAGNIIKEKLFALKHALLHSIQKTIPQPEAGLLGGLLLGGRDALSGDLQNIFRQAGVIHIVVLSGYNITIVAEAIMRIFSFLTLPLRLSLGAGAIILFAIMTGASATVIRASLMALLVLLARAIGRKYDISRALLLAGLFMVIQNPKILVFDLSFQLSFLATVGLIYISPMLENFFKRAPSVFQFRELIISTLATQICVLPLLLYTNGLFSTVGLPVNLLVLPLIPLTMLVGFISGVTGLISSMLALPFAYGAYLLLRYEILIPTFAVSLPYASVSIPYFPVWIMAICYAVLILILYRKKTNERSLIALPPNSNSYS